MEYLLCRRGTLGDGDDGEVEWVESSFTRLQTVRPQVSFPRRTTSLSIAEQQ